MPYKTPLEARIAKKTTKAITDFNMIEDGDRVMVGLSGGKDSWALIQILDVLRQRAPIEFSIVAVNVDSGYEGYQHQAVAAACRERGWEFYSEHTSIGAVIDDKLESDDTPCSLCAQAASWCALPDGEAGGRLEDRARSSPRRLRRDRAPQPVLCRVAQGDARPPGLRQPGPRRDSAAGVRDRGRGARLCQGARTADHRLLLPGVRRPGPAAATGEAPDHGARARASGREGVDDQGARQRDAASPARSPAQSGRRPARDRRHRAGGLRRRAGGCAAHPADAQTDYQP